MPGKHIKRRHEATPVQDAYARCRKRKRRSNSPTPSGAGRKASRARNSDRKPGSMRNTSFCSRPFRISRSMPGATRSQAVQIAFRSGAPAEIRQRKRQGAAVRKAGYRALLAEELIRHASAVFPRGYHMGEPSDTQRVA